MDAINFAYWLQSQFELNNAKSFNLEQTKIIKQHAQLVLKTVEINEIKNKPYQSKPGLTPKPYNNDRRYLC